MQRAQDEAGCMFLPAARRGRQIAWHKRVGAVAAFVFLALNGVQPTADNDTYADLVLAVARGETAKSAGAECFRTNTIPA